MENNLQQNITKLKDQIFITRKVRINASERCKTTDNIIFLLNIEYSIWLIILSIIYLNKTGSPNINIISITTSILCFAFTMLGYTLDYKEKYHSYKICYIQLQVLNNKLDNISCSDQNAKEAFNEIYENYTSILNTTDNHREIDYYKLILSDSWVLERVEKSLNINEIKAVARNNRIKNFLIITILAFMPIIVPIIIKYITILFNILQG